MTFPFSTLSELALHVGTLHQNPSALVYKRRDRWRPIASDTFLASVRRAGECLMALGVKPGDRVGLSAESSPFWLMADLAILGAGGVTVPMFPNAARDTLRHQIADSGLRVLIVGSRELRETLRPLCGDVHILVLSPRLMTGERQEEAASGPGEGPELIPAAGGVPVPPFDASDASDASAWAYAGADRPDSWDARAHAVKPEDPATLIYTSGSTGHPKGVELTHANLLSQIQAARLRFPLLPDDSALSFLPLTHVFERMVSYFYLASGVSLHFAEDPRSAGQDLREIRPTLLTVVPRFLEKAHDLIITNARKQGGLGGKFAQAALRRAGERTEESPVSWRDSLFDRLVYSPVRERMGGRLRLVICGSAALDPKLARFFINIGVDVYEGYGQTESAPVLTANHPGHRKLGTVGQAFPGVEIRLAPDGEVLARGPNVMRGYFGRPDATRETIVDGWLHTGDLGRLDEEGYLTIIGRKKELFKTTTGKFVAPLPIEQAFAAHRLVDSAVVIAEGRPYVTAVIFPDFDELLAWRNELSQAAAGSLTGSFLRSQPVLDRFTALVDAVNANLNSWEKVYRFALADAPPSIEGGELTPTLKLRRHIVEAKYAAKIDALYHKKA